MDSGALQAGTTMYRWAADLFPMWRSLTGPGVRQTIDYLQTLLPGLARHAVPSGTPAFDWTVPDEWTLREAYIENEAGQRVIDIANTVLHVVGYSTPVDQWLDLADLKQRLYTLPDQPDAVPYVTAYYTRTWGFCLAHRQLAALPPGRYRAVIDATLAPGELNYADLVLPGREGREVLLSTNICHPQMGNNEVSGIVVTAALAQWLAARPDRRFTYRIVFIPETIGALVYLSRHLAHMKAATVAGFTLSCVGDDRTYSFVESRLGGTLADRAAEHVLRRMAGDYQRYTFLDRGSDERQYCAPGVDLPVCSVLRSKYCCYPEYHNSQDDLSVISPAGLGGAFHVYQHIIDAIEANRVWQAVVPGEPQLGRRGLYPTVSQRDSGRTARTITNVLAYADGRHDLIALADRIGLDVYECAAIAADLAAAGLLREVAP